MIAARNAPGALVAALVAALMAALPVPAAAADPRAFDAASLPQAHAWCRALFDAALRGRVRVIVLDNTNTQRRDYAPYVQAVQAFNADIRSGAVAAGAPYVLRVLQVECRDAATLFLFNGRQLHGLTWQVSVNQWLRFQEDERAELVAPFIDEATEAPQLAAYARLSGVIEAQAAKDAALAAAGAGAGAGGQGGSAAHRSGGATGAYRGGGFAGAGGGFAGAAGGFAGSRGGSGGSGLGGSSGGGACFACGQAGHVARDCPRGAPRPQQQQQQ